MSFSESICLFLNNFFPKKKVKGRESPEVYSQTQYNWAQLNFKLYSPFVNLQDKIVLDAGCGLGGKTVFYAEKGCKKIKGIDIDAKRVEHGKEFVKKKQLTNVELFVGSLAEMPFGTNDFDVVFLNDVVEHIERPILIKALGECKRVIKEGGKICLEFPPWTSNDASHLYDYIHIPWCQVFFSDKTLINVLNKLAPGENTMGYLSVVEHYKELNKITYKEFKEIVKQLDFKVISLDLLMPFNLKILKYIPFFNKYLARRVVAVLSK